MHIFKSSAIKLNQFFIKSRDLWKKTSLKKQIRIRALETKVRDLLRSRDKWKLKLKEEKLKKDHEISLLQKKEHLEMNKQNKKLTQENEELKKSLLKKNKQIKELQEKDKKKLEC